MGYNLERLKRQYGLGSASKLGYLGTTEADKAAYDKYSDEFLLRLKNRPMYANQQFVGSDLPGNYYDNILGAPVYGEGEPVTGPVNPVPITTPVVTPVSSINGGGDGEGQRQRDRAAGIGVYVPQLHPYDSEQAKLMREYNKQGEYPFWDQVGLDINEAIDNYKTSGGIFGALGKGISNIFNGTEVDPGPKIRTITPAMSSAFPRGGARPLSYREPGFGALKSATASIPDFYNDAVALDRVPDNLGGFQKSYDVPNNFGGYQLGMGNNAGTPYDANEFSGTGMAMGSDFAPAPVATATVAPAPVLVDPGADFLARSQALSNEFNIPLGEAFDLADKISQQTTSNIQSVIPPDAVVPVRVRNNKQRSTVNSGGGGTGAAQRSGGYGKSKAPGESGSRFGLAQGGHIKGYAMGGPEDRYSTEEEIVLNAPVPDVSLEADVLDESLSMQGLIDQQTSNATGASSNTSDMLEMLKQSQVNYGDQIATQQGEYNTETKALQDMMNQMADSQSTGPSESEKWFRIAAAMGAPTKTGSFFENLGLANVAMADISKERREATTAGDLVKMRAAEFGLGLLKDQLSSTKTMSAAQLQRNQNIQDRIMEWDFEAARTSEENIFNLMTIKEQRLWETENRKSIPQTAAGLAAEEAGYDKGTPEYKEFVKAVVDRETRIQKLNIEALERKASSLTKPEIDARKEADKDIKSTEGAIKLLEEALELSPKAYAGDWYSVTKKALQGAIDSDDQKYKDSERLENLLSQGALATLKATFGGNISDGERAANLEITGAKMKTEKGRTETIRLALETMREYEKEANDRLTDILSGDYVKRTKSTR